jgi:hypothetical protein
MGACAGGALAAKGVFAAGVCVGSGEPGGDWS